METIKFCKEIEKALKKIESFGWKTNKEKTDNGYEIIIETCSPEGQEVYFNIEFEEDNIQDFKDEITHLYDSYDPEEETYIWLDNQGHTKTDRGAPPTVKRLLEDMEWVDKKLEELYLNI